ncbi:uncharacterized protein LOC126892301 [Diabrotica virgifera virgifera]|uniref:RNA-directed DNA polymerase from mobile element jockey-like n=1 Tax=Diabrotica virgifera virgifera TaxID=50390 RepID=A0ABM5L5Q4_DIAVI|nr:uncharacterized protein LOC126892301 [Diabrotica virgifera virgifera]
MLLLNTRRLSTNGSRWMVMLADDLKFWRVIDSLKDQALLQDDLDRLHNWCNQNKLHLNIKKCCFISFSRKVNRIETSYTINNMPLNYVSSIRDLGVIFDEKLTFCDHINTISIKASKLLGFVTRNCKYLSINSTRLVYCCLVRSILEYCLVVWSPYFQNSIDTLERVQHRFLRYCAYHVHTAIRNHDYSYIEQQLSLPPLKNRRDISGAIFIIHGFIDCPNLLNHIKFNVPKQALRYHQVFNIPFHRTTYGIHNPLDRYMGLLNEFDYDIFNLTLSRFKRSLAL